MNRIFFVFVLVLLCGKIFAQHPYIPIPRDSAIWVVTIEDWHEGEPNNPPHTFSYYVLFAQGKDTVVSGKNLMTLWGAQYFLIPTNYVSPAYSNLWIRQDTLAKKVWSIRDKQFMTEDLLYDFSLHVGDTLLNTQYRDFAPHDFWVDAMDSLYWIDGKWHYRWFIKSAYAQAVQIEGMGYTTGFFENPLAGYMPLIAYTYKVCCFRFKNQWLYTKPNPWNVDCDTMLTTHHFVGIDELNATKSLNEPMLFPNPVSNDGVLTLNQFMGKPWEEYHLMGYDVMGKTVLNESVKPGDNISLNKYHLTSGTYFFMVSDRNAKKVFSSKITFQ